MDVGAKNHRAVPRGGAPINISRSAEGEANPWDSSELTRSERIHIWLKRLVLAFCLLALGGIAASYTTTVYYNITMEQPLFTDFIKHISYLLFGVVMAGVAIVMIDRLAPAKRWLKYVIPVAFYVSLALVALVMVPGLGREVNGAKRFLDIGIAVFQPSELLKVTIVLYLGQLLCWWRKAPALDEPVSEDSSPQTARQRWASRRRGLFARREGRPVWPELPRRAGFIIAAAIGVTVIQPDLGSSFIILVVSFLTLVLAGVDWRHVMGWGVVLVVIGAVALGLLALAAPQKVKYIPERWGTYVVSVFNYDTVADENETGYQLAQARGALAAAGWFGVGYLNGKQKLNRLPFATNDFVFPVLVEELGYVGGLVVILLFLNLAFVGMRLAALCRDPFNRTVIAALGFAVCLQAFFHIGVTIGTFPLSGLTLPFFSAGGTSLLISTLAVGTMFALALSETQRKVRGAEPATN